MITHQHFAGICLEKPKRAHLQISEAVRDLIRSGKIAPGERIPSTRELAGLWHAHVPAVHAALTTLVREGLLVRVPGSGTFVRKREEKLTRVAIYFSQDVDSTADAPFLQASLKALRGVLEAKGIESDVWADPRPREQQNAPWTVLAAATRERRIQAVILPQADWDHLRWLSKLPVPLAHASSAILPNAVHLDCGQLAEVSLRTLAQQGCRSVGVITPLVPSATDPSGQRHGYYLFFERLLEVAGQLGLAIRDEWLRAAKDSPSGTTWQEAYGYRELHELWRQAERPDGLLVYPHATSRGVIMGLLEARVRVPDHLKLVLHKNAGVELFCPLPAALVVSDERELAEKLVELVEKQFRGESLGSARWSIRVADNDASAGTR